MTLNGLKHILANNSFFYPLPPRVWHLSNFFLEDFPNSYIWKKKQLRKQRLKLSALPKKQDVNIVCVDLLSHTGLLATNLCRVSPAWMLLTSILCYLAHRQLGRKPSCLWVNWQISGGRDKKGTSQLAHQCQQQHTKYPIQNGYIYDTNNMIKSQAE